MITKIARQDAIEKYPYLPLRVWDSKKEEYVEKFPQTYARYVLTLPSKSYRGQIKLLGTELKRLAKSLGFDKLVFLCDLNIAWLKQEHDFKPAKEALKYLADNKVGKRFNGALQLDTTQLSEFIIHLSWLVRTNTLLPYVYFVDHDQNFLGTICQYGNLHFSTITKTADEKFKNVILETKFEFITDHICFDKFSKSGAIKGRQISL